MVYEHHCGDTSGQRLRRQLCLLFSLTIGLVLVGAILLWPKVHALVIKVPQAEASPTASAGSGDSFVFRFDPAIEAFEVFTIPTAGAAPDGIAVFERPGITGTEVWFAESGADRIGRLVYTGTTDYALQEYVLPAGSRPLNVVIEHDGDSVDWVWFTENGRNRIGRIDADTGITHEFAISTTNVAPYDLDIAPDGSVWFTERDTDQIGHLVVTTTTDYKVREFHVGRTDAGLSGILVEGNDKIWAVLSDHDRLARLQPSVPQVDRTPPLDTPGYPLMLVAAPDGLRMWFTELHGNNISMLFGSTMEFGLRYTVPTSNSHPYDLDVDSTGAVWFSEQLGGKIGRLVVASTGTFTEFPVPLPRARIQGLAVDSDDVVWFVADSRYTVHLPFVSNTFPPPSPVFGVQTYWPLSNDNGLDEMQAMNAYWVRVQFSWESVEPADATPDHFNWSSWDAAASGAASAGLSIVANVQSNPAWAAEYPGGPLYPDHVVDFVELMGAAAERYDGDGYMDAPGSPVIQHWEFYNEPDNASVLLAEAGYGYWGDYGAEYADLYRQVHPAMKAANPVAKLLNGGVAYERFREEDLDFPYVRRFLDDFFAAGGGNYIDVFNFHYYPGFAYRWEPYGRELIGKTAYFRSMLAQYELNLPIACTEIGQHSDPSRGGSHETQSQYVVKTFVWTMAADLEYTTWFTLRDITSGFPYLYGLLNDSWQRKPSFYAFSVFTEQLGDARFVRTMSDGELGYDAAEGYVFLDQGQHVYVVWMNDEVTRPLRFGGSAAQVVDKYGVPSSVSDGDDGIVDGIVTVNVGPSPVYVRSLP
jgi:streptogramin lyase